MLTTIFVSTILIAVASGSSTKYVSLYDDMSDMYRGNRFGDCNPLHKGNMLFKHTNKDYGRRYGEANSITILATVPRTRTVNLQQITSCKKTKSFRVDTFKFRHRRRVYEMFARPGTFTGQTSVAGAKSQATMACPKGDIVCREVAAVNKFSTVYKVTFQKEGRRMIFERVDVLADNPDMVPEAAVSAEHGAAADSPEFSADSGDQPTELEVGGGDVNQYTAEQVKFASGLRRRLCRASDSPAMLYGASS